jgi:PKD repeat protein
MVSRKALVAIALVMIIVPGGILLGLTRSSALSAGPGVPEPVTQNVQAESPASGSFGAIYGTAGASSPGENSPGPSTPIYAATTVVSTAMETTVAGAISTEAGEPASGGTTLIQGNTQQSETSQTGAPLSTAATSTNASRDIEFFTNLTLQATSASTAYAKATAVAFSVGGYVADSTESNTSALVVVRVPAASYQDALMQLEGLGTLVTLSSSSDDVTVQYTDLNATLLSLQAEQASLLTILGQSSNINSTLNVESRIQGVDQQINSVESEILQTRTLVSYATISALIEQKAPTLPLSIKLTATPKSGDSPLSVTFNAITKGGEQPYIVNYNFGDGSSYQGQSLIHTFEQPGTYNVTVTATDASANVTEAWTVVNVSAPPATSSLSAFSSFAGGLFLQVIEGIVEVAVVVIPIAAALLVVLFPLRHRLGLSSKQPRQSGQAGGAASTS